MTEVVSVRFKNHGKVYYFAPDGLEIAIGENVVVETSKGLEFGECVSGNQWVEDEHIVPPLRSVVRIATDDDKRIVELNRDREKEAFAICQKKIAAHGLDMKLVDVECSFEGNKIIFYFASEGRVDFRDLVKDLASVFRTRIELRQIGVRDEAKMLGGLGICGRPFCCSEFLCDFAPVSTKMAKTQSMSLNPSKISGSCGRLMCCLRYEQEAYEELVKNVPKNGAFVQTPQGYGNITQINLLRQKIKVKLDGPEQAIKTFDVGEVAAVPGGRPKPGAPLPDVLKLQPKEEPEPEAEQEVQSTAVMVIEESGTEALVVSEAPAPPAVREGGSGEERHGKPRRRSRKPRQQGEGRQPHGDKQPQSEQKQSSRGDGKSAPQPRGEKKPGHPPHKKQPRPESKPKGEKAAKPDGGDGQPKKNDSRRRFFRRKPKSGQPPKSE